MIGMCTVFYFISDHSKRFQEFLIYFRIRQDFPHLAGSCTPLFMKFRNCSQTSRVHPPVNILFFAHRPSCHNQKSRPDHRQQESEYRAFHGTALKISRIVRLGRDTGLIQHLHIHLSHDHFRHRRIILNHGLKRYIGTLRIHVRNRNRKKIRIFNHGSFNISGHHAGSHILCHFSFEHSTGQNVRKCCRHLFCRRIVKKIR